MVKDSTILFGVIGAIAVILFLGGGQLFSSVVDDNTRIINWNGYETKISSSSKFVKTPCQGYPTEVAGYVTPSDDSNGTGLSIQAISQVDRGCANDASATADVTIPSPKDYTSIFITMSGTLSSGARGADSNLGVSLSQEGGNSAVLFSAKSENAKYDTGVKPSPILLKFDGDFIQIPSLGATFQLKNNNPLHLSISASTSQSGNRDTAQASFSMSPFEVVKTAVAVVPVTPTVNTTTSNSTIGDTISNIPTLISDAPIISPIIDYFFEEDSGISSTSVTTTPVKKTFPLFEIVLLLLIIGGFIIFARWMKWI